MPWDERQHAMLAEMGIRLWSPPRSAQAAAAAPLASPAVSLPAPAADDWHALQQAVAVCTACGLHASRQQAVFGDGAAPADWLVLVDPPTDADELAGAPAAGRDGALLDQMLKALGLSRRSGDGAAPSGRAVVTPILKCRPPLNRAPQAQELAACDVLLLRQLALVRPKVVLAMGRFAAQALLQTELPIGRLRGQAHRPARLGGVPVVVTYPAAFLLRNPADKAKAWDDLCLARALADGTDDGLPAADGALPAAAAPA